MRAVFSNGAHIIIPGELEVNWGQPKPPFIKRIVLSTTMRSVLNTGTGYLAS